MRRLLLLSLLILPCIPSAHAAIWSRAGQEPKPNVEEPRPPLWKRALTATGTGLQSLVEQPRKLLQRATGTEPERNVGNGVREIDGLRVTILAPAPESDRSSARLECLIRVENMDKRAVQLTFRRPERFMVSLTDNLGRSVETALITAGGQREPTLVVINGRERVEYTASFTTAKLRSGASYQLEAVSPAFPKLRAVKTFRWPLSASITQ